MAKQRYRESIDNLSYSSSTVPYAPAPVKEILALTAKKEADYLQTKNAINLADTLKKTMPYHESSKNIYDEMVANVDNSLSTITPDNYSDNTLNTQQIAVDAMNKYGGIELGKQKADYDAKAAAIAASGIRPEKQAYKLAKMKQATKGITKDENGKFVVEPVPMPRLVPDIDVAGKLDSFMKDWKADTLYSYNSDGTINVSKELAGKLGITKTERITENELRQGAMAFLELDPNIQEYLDDEADFMTKGRGMGIEDLYKSLTPAQLESLIPGKKAENITAEDVRLATEGNEGMLQSLGNHLLKKGIKEQYVKGYSDLMANKYSYDKEDKTYYDDVEFIEAAKARYKPATAAEVTPPLVTISPLTTLQKVSPTSMVELDKSIDAFASKQPQLIQDLRGFEDLLKNAKTDADILSANQSIAGLREQIEKNDTAIQQAQQQKRNITQSVFTIGESNGVGIDATYEKERAKIIESTNTQNISRMVSRGFSTPYTPALNKALNDAGQGDLVVINKEDTTAIKAKELLSSDYILKDGNTLTYVGVPTASALSGAKGKATAIYNTINQKAIKFKDSDSYFKQPATKEQYREAVAQAYLNPDYESYNEDYVVTNSVNKLGNDLRKIKDVGEAKVNQTFDALYVDPKAGPKTAASEINELTAQLKDSVIKSASSFKVYNETGDLIDLPLHVKSLGIDMSADYIDYTKFKPGLLLNADREYGQKLNLSLPLTAKGRELVREKMGVDFFEGSDAVTLVGVESSGKEGVFNTKLGSSIARVYAESFKDLSAGGEESRKVLGTIAFNNSRYSKDFYSKNLYSLAPGTNVKFEAEGGTIRINAARRTPNPKKMSDNDYFITDEKESATFVYDKTTGRSNFVKNEVLKADKATNYQIQYFASPEDIGGLLGKSMLNNQMYNLNSQATQNAQTSSTGRSYTVAPDSVQSSSYKSDLNSVLKQYSRKAVPSLLTNFEGKEESYALKVPPNALTDLRNSVAKSIDKQAYLPYVNTAVASKAISLINDYGLTVTNALRDANKNFGTKGASSDSFHQYGYSLDARYNKEAESLLNFAKSNPTQLANMGINYVYKHVIDGVPHLHIDLI